VVWDCQTPTILAEHAGRIATEALAHHPVFLLQFDITDPRRPKFVKSINPPVSEVPCS
jgi:hypothetical protein